MPTAAESNTKNSRPQDSLVQKEGSAGAVDTDRAWILVRHEKQKVMEENDTTQTRLKYASREPIKPTTQTVVLKPTCKKSDTGVCSKDGQGAIADSGMRNKNNMSVYVHRKANEVAITTTNPLLTSRLPTIENIPIGSQVEIPEVTAYGVLSSNQCR